MSDCEKHPTWDAWTGVGSCPECYIDACKKIEYYQPLVDAVCSIIDGLDDPYRGLTWHEVTKELCADELDRIREILVPAVNTWIAARAAAKGGGDV